MRSENVFYSKVTYGEIETEGMDEATTTMRRERIYVMKLLYIHYTGKLRLLKLIASRNG